MILYSIIIPHYNSPTLLARCIESIPHRNDIQIIVVDDCSSQEHQKRLKDFSNSYNNVQFIFSSKNGGAGAARNIGLTYAKGEWVLFADADDYFLEDAFSIFDNHVNDKEDAILFGNKSVSSKSIINTRGNFINDNIKFFIENHLSAQLTFLCTWVPWAKMIKRNYIEKYQFKFEEVKYGNDVFWNTQIAANTERIAIYQQPVYAITQEKNSLTTNRNSVAFFTRYNVSKRANQYLDKINKTFLKQPVTLEFASWARELGFHFYISFLCKSIRQNCIFEGKNIWVTFAKINNNVLCKSPILFLIILLLIPSFFLKMRKIQ